MNQEKMVEKLARETVARLSDQYGNIVLSPREIMETLEGRIRSKRRGYEISTDGKVLSIPVEHWNISALEVVMKQRSGEIAHRGRLSAFAIFTVVSGKKHILNEIKIDEGLYYNENTESWWIDPNTPSRENPDLVKKFLDRWIKITVNFLNKYLRKVEQETPKDQGGDLEMALWLNKQHNLGLDEDALETLFELLER